MQRWARRPKSSQQLALRSRIVLACAEGRTNIAVAELLGINGLEADPAAGATHFQLTTGDAATFRALAGSLFGVDFLDVEQVELAVATR